MKVAERLAAGEAEGALVLFHGRGADEYDLLPLLDELDPERRLDGFCPRGPLALPPGGAHWYIVPRVGYPDPPSFAIGYGAACEFVDSLTHARIVLGGFSQGAVLALSVGLGAGRPKPAAVIAFSGFLPEVEGWSLGDGPWPPIAIGHERLEAAGATVLYREYPLPHAIDPGFVAELRPWLASAVATSA